MSFFEAIQPGGPAYDPSGSRFGGQKLYDFAASQNKAQNIAAGPGHGGYQVQAPRGGAANYSAPSHQQQFNPFHSAIMSMLAAPKPKPPIELQKPQTDPFGILDILAGKSSDEEGKVAPPSTTQPIPATKTAAPPGPPPLDPNTAIQNPADFSKALLQGLGVPATPDMINAVTNWAKQEGGNWQNQASFNPLNTTQDEPGAGNTGSQGNIKQYQNWAQGLQATEETLTQPQYANNVMAALQSGNPQQLNAAIASSPWGTGSGGDYTKPSGVGLSQQAASGNFAIRDPNSPQHQAVAFQAGDSNTGKAVSSAMTQIGVGYVWGGETENQGFDCSGLTQWAYGKSGIQLPRVAQDQYNASAKVDPKDAKPGDLVFFGDPSNVHHVGIYMGNNQMLDAPNSGSQVRIESMNGWDTLGFGRPQGSQGGVPAYPGGPSPQGGTPRTGGGGGGSGASSGGGGGPMPVGPEAAQNAQQLPLLTMALAQPNQQFDPLSILSGALNKPQGSQDDQGDVMDILTGGGNSADR